jgi:ribonuclease D
MKIHKLITTTEALADLCARLSKADFVCVDTEFMRESTYWPELCLIQIADDKEAAAIDPKAPGWTCRRCSTCWWTMRMC